MGFSRCLGWFGSMLFSISAHAFEHSGRWGGDTRHFTQDVKDQNSLFVEVEARWTASDRDRMVVFKSFARYDDVDDDRSHIDIRDFYFLTVEGPWEIRAGVNKVFWGVAESHHLVDIVNQNDQVESPDGADKLGQPMLQLSLVRDWGVWDIFFLPYFRERIFGALYQPKIPSLTISQESLFESDAKNQHRDFAMRYSHHLGSLDLGLSYFKGTSREPKFVSVEVGELAPYYYQMEQFGTDIQATLGPWLLKFEGLARRDSQTDFVAFISGFEYSFYGIHQGAFDLGALVEFSRDSRGLASFVPEQKDVFVGTRLTFNDVQSSELLMGVSHDLDTASYTAKVEFSRRFFENIKLSLDGWIFKARSPADPIYLLNTQDYVQLSAAYYF